MCFKVYKVVRIVGFPTNLEDLDALYYKGIIAVKIGWFPTDLKGGTIHALQKLYSSENEGLFLLNWKVQAFMRNKGYSAGKAFT